ncbi:hypothetical protein EC968_005140, partial [Mortierella alpina]
MVAKASSTTGLDSDPDLDLDPETDPDSDIDIDIDPDTTTDPIPTVPTHDPINQLTATLGRLTMATSLFATPVPENATMPAIKIRPPEAYEGARDGFKCEAWLATLRRYLIGAHVPVAERTLHSVMLLKGPAALWWEGLRLPDDTHIDVFVDRFREAFRPRNFIESVRAELLRITMTSTLAEYVTRFRRLIAVLTPEGEGGTNVAVEEFGRTVFMQGLKPELHRMIFANMQLATANIEDVINAAEYYTNFIGTDSSSSTPIAPPRHNPMAMDLDHLAVPGLDQQTLQVVVNAIMQAQQQQRPYRPNNQQRPRPNNNYQQHWSRTNNNNNRYTNTNNRNNNNNHHWSQLPPLTAAERQRLLETGGCFKCRKTGHQSWQGICANFIETNEDAPLPGNAPS